MRGVMLTIAGAAIAALSSSILHAQPVTSFADVAGKWNGVGSRGAKTEVTIEPNGRFVIDSGLGRTTGQARMEDGIVVLSFDNNQGQIRFTRTGDVLEGPYVAGTLTGTTRVTRVR